MIKPSVFSLITVIFAVAYSAPLSSEEEVMNQLLLLREAAKLFTHMEANKQGMISTLPQSPFSSPLYNPSLYGKGRASQQRKLSKDVLLKVRDLLNMGRAKYSTLVSHNEEMQRKSFQHLFSKILEISNYTPDELASSMIDTTKAKLAAMLKGRLQGYTNTRNLTREREQQANELYSRILTCLVESSQNYIEYLKKNKNFGTYGSILLEQFQKLLAKTGIDQYKTFINIVSSFLHGGSKGSLVAKEQDVNWDFLFDILRDMLKTYADSAPEQIGNDYSNKDLLINTFNVVSILVRNESINKEDKTIFNNSINILLENYLFKKIDRMEMSEDAKDAMKNAIRDAAKNVLLAFFKQRNHEELNSPNRSTLLRSMITLLAGINIGAGANSSLLHFADQLLSENPTDEELMTKSQCLVVLFLRNGLENVLSKLTSELKKGTDEVKVISCLVDAMMDGFRMIIANIPDSLGNIGGCEDIPVSREAEKVNKLSRRFVAPIPVHSG